MAFKNQSVFTATFTNTTFAIDASMGLSIVSINLLSGSGTITGSTTIPGLTTSSAALAVGLPVLLRADAGYTLDGIIIDGTTGSFEVIAK
jgi:hypothetical protein